MFLRSKADPIELRLLDSTRSSDQRLVNHQVGGERKREERALTSNAERKHTDHYDRNLSGCSTRRPIPDSGRG